MGKLSRLIAVEQQLLALLPVAPPVNPTTDEIKAWAEDVRRNMAAGRFSDYSPEEWARLLDDLAWIDALD